MALDLTEKRILVVGAGGGIGAATPRAFAGAGARVFAAGRPGPKLDAVAADIGSESVALDILDNDAIEAFFATAEPFDHVVIAAATKSGPVARLPLDDAKTSMESKFWGAYRIARAAKVAQGGSITFVSGLLSHGRAQARCCRARSTPRWRRSAAGWPLSARRSGSTPVSPGLIDTPLWGGIRDADREAMFARTAEHLPARRIGQPEDIAQAILFLATNPFATGTTVTVDGGGTIA